MKPDNLIFELRVCNLPRRYQAEKFFLFEKIDRQNAAPFGSSVPCLVPHPAEHASNTGRGSGVGHVASADHIESGAYVPLDRWIARRRGGNASSNDVVVAATQVQTNALLPSAPTASPFVYKFYIVSERGGAPPPCRMTIAAGLPVRVCRVWQGRSDSSSVLIHKKYHISQ